MAKKKAPQKKKSPAKASSKKAPQSKTTSKKKVVKKVSNIVIGADKAKKTPKTKSKNVKIRFPAEELYKEELEALIQNDTYPKPPNWQLSPKMVELFITGTDEEFVLNKKK